jgi:hypothetical protein
MQHGVVWKAKRQAGPACGDAKARDTDVTAAFGEHAVDVIEPIAVRRRGVHRRPLARQVPAGFVFKPWFM